MTKNLLILSLLLMSACVYRLDIQQGNSLDQKEIDKLRKDLTKNQVLFVLGSSVINDNFSDDKWVYLYSLDKKNKNTKTTKKLVLSFQDDKLVSAHGDYKIPESLKLKQ